MKSLIKNIYRIGLGVAVISMTSILSSCDPDETQTVVNFTNLVWEDNFSTDGAPDPANWTYDLGDGTAVGLPVGWGNEELQVYTSNSENVVVQNGLLAITAIADGAGGYTSARIKTEGLANRQWTYGRFEARIKLPWGKGMWPAFWMLGTNSNTWPQRGEIDIMENRGDQPTIIKGSVHGPGYSGGNSVGKDYELANDRFDSDFHVFGVEWGPNYINYYVDDVLYQQLTPSDVEGSEWVFNDNPFFLILNVAVGGNFSGNPDANTIFPQTMYVDYVRVYSNN